MPRAKNKSRKVGAIPSGLMKEALERIIENKASIRNVSEEYAIPFTTLWRYVYKYKFFEHSTDVVFEPKYNCRKVFSDAEETMLKDYFIKASKIHHGLSAKSARKLAYQFAIKANKSFPSNWEKNKSAGKDWLSGFLKRFPELALRKPEAISLARATSFNKTNVSSFFDKLEECLKRAPYSPSDIYNTDETGCTTVQSVRNAKVIACRNEKQVGKLTSGERGALVTALYAVNAAGNSVPPMLVFPRVKFRDHMMKGAPPDSISVANPSGWMSTACFTEFMKHFIKHTKRSKDCPVILILDNHDSHISIETINLSKENGVPLLTLPPHCSHKLQPLDRSVYGPFKTFYNKAANAFMVCHPGNTITIYDVAELVGKADEQALTPRTIRSGFAASGIWPFNRDVFGEDEFLTSYVSDRPHCSTTDRDTTTETEDVLIRSSALSTSFGIENALEFLSISAATITPEIVAPLHQCTQQRKKSSCARKRRKTQILIDTPVKEAIVVEEMLTEKKRKKKLNLKNAKKKIIQCSRSSSENDSDVAICFDESDISFSQNLDANHYNTKELQTGNFVLCKFSTEKGRIAMYVGIITSVGVEYEVKFLRKSYWGCFTFPNVADICDVAKSDVVLKLSSPQTSEGTSRAGRQLSFSVNLTAYKKFLC